MTEEGDDVKPKINIMVDFEAQSCTIKIKASTPLKKVFEAAEKRFGKEPGTLKFTLEGARIRPQQTPADLGMEEGDIIQAHLEQLGGWERYRYSKA